ncbi:MAG: hypothetical protein EA348_11065 [Pseudomonadaceae bacterium]|nr:MAG: hypothetical protein EA348_11065 [Pseudomonadaceae bacterium]
MQDDLDSQLRRYYQNRRLSADDVDALVQAGRAQRRWHWQSPLPWATAMLLMVALAFTALLPHNPSNEMADWLRADIAKNHLAGKPDDLAARDLVSLVSELESFGLGFALPQAIELYGKVVGARMCSLAGKPAIHVYLDSDGTEKSLFVTAASESLSGVASELEKTPGLSIEVWSEQNHFFALASDY